MQATDIGYVIMRTCRSDNAKVAWVTTCRHTSQHCILLA